MVARLLLPAFLANAGTGLPEAFNFYGFSLGYKNSNGYEGGKESTPRMPALASRVSCGDRQIPAIPSLLFPQKIQRAIQFNLQLRTFHQLQFVSAPSFHQVCL